MKRREFLTNTLTAAGLAGAGLLGVERRASGVQAAEQPSGSSPVAATKIILIGRPPDHPPGTHLYMKECGLLAKCLEQTPGVTAIVSEGWPQDAAVLDGASAVFFYSPPGAELLFPPKKPDQAEQAAALLKRGVGLSALHWATGIGDAGNQALGDSYLSALGGLFGFAWSGLTFSTTKVQPVLPDHPVSRGWNVFDVKDEWYLNLKFRPEAKPVAKIRVKAKEGEEEKDQVVAWVYERKDSGGRSYGNTMGHYHENFGLEPFRKAVVNGILWTAHREIPDVGAPCAVTADDMKL